MWLERVRHDLVTKQQQNVHKTRGYAKASLKFGPIQNEHIWFVLNSFWVGPNIKELFGMDQISYGHFAQDQRSAYQVVL